MCLISVVIPVFNTSEFLEWLLESISRTQGIDLEFIFVDDASRDDSSANLKRFIQKHTWLNAHLLVHQRNSGLSVARRSGYERASGEYIWFLDSDDHFNAEALRKVYEIVQTRRFDAVIFDHRECRLEDGEMRYLSVVRRSHAAEHSTSDGRGAMISCLRDRNVYAWGLIARKGTFQNHFFPPGRLFEDIPTIPMVLASCHSVKYASQAVVNYLLRPDSIMHNVNMKSCIDLMLAGERLRLRAARFQGGLDGRSLQEIELYRALCLLWAARRAHAGGQWEMPGFRKILTRQVKLYKKLSGASGICLNTKTMARRRMKEVFHYTIMMLSVRMYRVVLAFRG
ncbi:glycosyltransferase family 2 protein [Nitratireductor sp.]|uniref:glycosyltransferase family 2 protein n=1 Tax=Nitratireductor sp. TaxID=1872084 RepID=UPI0025EBA49D|nr:glycosyltransferase family 2 protein [Nitratireductor sp.]